MVLMLLLKDLNASSTTANDDFQEGVVSQKQIKSVLEMTTWQGHYPPLYGMFSSVAEQRSVACDIHYNGNDDMMTYNNTSRPPLSFD